MEPQTMTKRMPNTLFSCIMQVRDAYLAEKLELPLAVESLRSLGMKKWHIHPTKRSLLDLQWFSDGYPTSEFERMAQASQADRAAYQSILKTLLKEGIYAEPSAHIAEAHIDLAKASATQIERFFSGYDPQSEARNMAYLYLSFCREAGLIPPLENRPHLSNGKFTSKGQQTVELETASETQEGKSMDGRTAMHQDAKTSRIERQRKYVLELLETLPYEEGQDREWWVDALRSNVELLIKLYSRKDEGMKT